MASENGKKTLSRINLVYAAPSGPNSESPGLTLIARAVLVALAMHDGNACFPSVKRLARCVGCSTRAVTTALLEVDTKGWVIRRPRFRADGSQASNEYQLTYENGLSETLLANQDIDDDEVDCAPGPGSAHDTESALRNPPEPDACHYLRSQLPNQLHNLSIRDVNQNQIAKDQNPCQSRQSSIDLSHPFIQSKSEDGNNNSYINNEQKHQNQNNWSPLVPAKAFYELSDEAGQYQPALAHGLNADCSAADAARNDFQSQGYPRVPTATPSPVKGQPAATPVSIVFEHWKKVMVSPKSKLDTKRTRVIKARLQDWPVDDLLKAIDGCAADPFSMGEHDRSVKYNSIELICRDNAHVEKFIDLAPKPIVVLPPAPPRVFKLDPKLQAFADKLKAEAQALEPVKSFDLLVQGIGNGAGGVNVRT